MRALVNAGLRPDDVVPPVADALAFHAELPGYRPTPVRALDAVASEVGVAEVGLKDESDRLGLPAFKVLGASWAVEQALQSRPDIEELIAASAGNHGRAVARVAAARGLECRVFLPARSLAARREAIASEGAQVVVVDGTYEDAVAAAAEAASQPGAIEIADVGDSDTARWVIDGYATLFAEIEDPVDTIIVPVGVGSLAAAAARYGAAVGARVVGAEPVTAGCLTASLEAGEPVAIPTPGTTMAGLDCAEVSTAAWPTLHAGIHATVLVSDAEAAAAMRSLEDAGLLIGESGAAPLAALRALASDPACDSVRDAIGLGPSSRVLLIATEGRTGGE